MAIKCSLEIPNENDGKNTVDAFLELGCRQSASDGMRREKNANN